MRKCSLLRASVHFGGKKLSMHAPPARICLLCLPPPLPSSSSTSAARAFTDCGGFADDDVHDVTVLMAMGGCAVDAERRHTTDRQPRPPPARSTSSSALKKALKKALAAAWQWWCEGSLMTHRRSVNESKDTLLPKPEPKAMSQRPYWPP